MHRPYVETVREVAAEYWGREFASTEEAKKHLLSKGADVTAAALLELVRRVNQVIAALAQDDPLSACQEQDQEPKPPAHAKAFPGKKLGDVLYSYDPDEGLDRVVIVAVHDGGFVRFVHEDPYVVNHRTTVFWADRCYFATEAEAMRNGAEHDLKYHGPKVQYARDVLAGIEQGADLARFRAGSRSDEDDENEPAEQG